MCGEGLVGGCRRVDGMSEEGRGGVGQAACCLAASAWGGGLGEGL